MALIITLVIEVIERDPKMRLFSCPSCQSAIHFENSVCHNCGTAIGYDAETNTMIAIGEDNLLCANAAHGACNWISRDGLFCRACRHNETIPDLSLTDNLTHWQVLERAKKRLFYGLIRFGLPLITKAEDEMRGLSFRFLADTEEAVMTGHDNGLITIALAEADDAERERRRAAMHEPYRTLLGHFRHEIAHYYWDLLVADQPPLDQCRAIFGDERADYGAALQHHYANGAPPDWQQSYVSTYATAHPWEDFAETCAHYQHIVDTLETAASLGVSMAPRRVLADDLSGRVNFDPYRISDIAMLVESWVAVSVMLNELNRSMGQPDAYPFVLSQTINTKLAFISRLIKGQ